MMNADIKARWVNALRSGEYPQTNGILHRVSPAGRAPVGFCCLGVLCDLAEQDGVATSRPNPFDDSIVAYVVGDGEDTDEDTDLECGVLPDGLRDWAGLPAKNPDVEIDGEPRSLAGLNDSGLPFSKIADLVEKQL